MKWHTKMEPETWNPVHSLNMYTSFGIGTFLREGLHNQGQGWKSVYRKSGDFSVVMVVNSSIQSTVT